MLRASLLGCLLVALSMGGAQAGDIAGAADHPALGGRYPGAEIVRQTVTEFEAFTLYKAKVAKAGEPGDHEALEGKLTRTSYAADAGRSTLEVMANYELALTEQGFETLWECANGACGGRAFNHTVVPYWQGFAENYSDQRYLAARAGDGGSAIGIYVVKNGSEGGANHDKIYVQVDVLETVEMDTGLEVVEAAEMKTAIDAQGHIALYGILFDVDKADIKPESAPAIAEIGKFLKADGALKLFVVGHTDNQGTLAYNLDLSERRAASVVKALTDGHSIAAARLSPHGLGFLAPVASNADAKGQAANRRVELVAQ